MDRDQVIIIGFGLSLFAVGFEIGLLTMNYHTVNTDDGLIVIEPGSFGAIVANIVCIVVIGGGGFMLGVGVCLSQDPPESPDLEPPPNRGLQ